MSNLAFDTHKFVKDLTKTGMASDQAEVLANHYARLLDDRLATKDDSALSETALKADITSVETALRAEIASLRKDMMVTILSAQLVSITIICSVIGFMLTF